MHYIYNSRIIFEKVSLKYKWNKSKYLNAWFSYKNLLVQSLFSRCRSITPSRKVRECKNEAVCPVSRRVVKFYRLSRRMGARLPPTRNNSLLVSSIVQRDFKLSYPCAREQRDMAKFLQSRRILASAWREDNPIRLAGNVIYLRGETARVSVEPQRTSLSLHCSPIRQSAFSSVLRLSRTHFPDCIRFSSREFCKYNILFAVKWQMIQ